ncbi:MAG TPA: SpoIIE family protein phosphatase [Bryobacteraceae bacterium]|jgi:serine phosphatase RsbU (regulator of sigma subunit)/pSer/pThr/pTyr-binding forkhead associated (FHA) protein
MAELQAAASEAAPGPSPAAFLVLNPSGQRTRVEIEQLPFSVGRNAGNDLVLRDNRVSRNHFRILADNGHYAIEDLNSRHGTWINGERVARRRLRNSDRIDFGIRESYQLTFTQEASEINRILDRFPTSRPGGENPNNLEKLRSLMEVARALQNSLSTQEVLTAVVDAALSMTGCERGFLMLRKPPELEVAIARDREGKALQAEDLRVPTSVIQRALNSRRDLLSMSFDPLTTQGATPARSIMALELRSVVCLPLVRVQSGMSEETRMSTAAEATVGLLYLDSRAAPADLSAGNRELLQTLAIEASTILENARLLEEQRVKERIEHELRVARDIQQGLLPVTMPLEGWFRAAGSSLPATQVGGDYFDVRQLSPDLWASVIADVSGKGVSSALLAGLLQGAFLMAAARPTDIEGMLGRLNEFLLDRTRGEKYATVFYCTLDSTGRLSYANAGHCAPYLVSLDGRLRKLHTTGMPVGMLEEAVAQKVEAQLAPGDKLVLYSDGLTETENAEGVFFDSDRLRVFLRDNSRKGAADLHASLLAAVDRFSEGGVVRDDVTLLVLEYAPPE